MNELTIFENSEFGSIRTLDINGKLYFVASDVAKALGYARPNDAISAHCRYTAKHSIPHPQSKTKTIEVNVIPQGDVVRLAVKSELEGADNFDENNSAYQYYGGRGVAICPEWLGEHGFEHFYKWAVENGYNEGLSIERKDVNGNYCPENCCWITMKKQAQNKTNSVIAMETGRSLSFENSIVGIVSEHTAMTRYTKYGWGLYDATHIPQLKQGIHYKKWIKQNPEYLKNKERMKNMNLEMATIQDCLDNYQLKNKVALINDGTLQGFEEENENPHTDR